MTISEHVSGLLEHPFFKQAVAHYVSGDTADLKHLLSIVMVHTHQITRYDCVRKYKANKWFNIPEIITVISEVPFPEKIKYELPIPPLVDDPIVVEKECRVIPLMTIKHRRYPRINFAPNQLELPFIFSKASRILQEA